MARKRVSLMGRQRVSPIRVLTNCLSRCRRMIVIVLLVFIVFSFIWKDSIQQHEKFQLMEIIEWERPEDNSLCDNCTEYPLMERGFLQKCKTCFIKVKKGDVFSPEATARNKLLLEYHEKAKTATVYKQRLPDIIGLGVRKCGTGWMQYALSRHPMLKLGRKEAHFFNLKDRYEQGLEFYRGMMANISKYELAMEKTPGYFNYVRHPLNVPKAIHTDVPDAKLWAILCDPVPRSLSDYVQMAIMEEAPIPATFAKYVDKYLPLMEQALNTNLNLSTVLYKWPRADTAAILLTLGIYHPMMKEWMKYYTRENLHIISGEEMIRNPGPVVEKLQNFLGIPKMLLAEDFVQDPETGFYCVTPTVVIDSELYKTKMQCMHWGTKGRTRAPKLKYNTSIKMALKKLEPFYAPHNEQLFNLLGQRLW